MTVRLGENHTILIEGRAGVEDAEGLTQLLLANPAAPVDWSGCAGVHTAVYQVILAMRPSLAGVCGDPWMARWLGNLSTI